MDKNEAFTRYFFVDYENVNRDGLNGITKLCKEDCVRIYYSSSAETLTFGLHRRINASQAHFDYIKVQMPIKNAVDCQILFDIRDLTKENRTVEYIIVSKDNDYDDAINCFCSQKIKIRRILDICSKDKQIEQEPPAKNTQENKPKNDPKKREAQVRSFFGQHFKKKKYTDHKEEIIQAVLKAKTKQQINNNLMKIYLPQTVGEIYKIIQPLIADLPGQ